MKEVQHYYFFPHSLQHCLLQRWDYEEAMALKLHCLHSVLGNFGATKSKRLKPLAPIRLSVLGTCGKNFLSSHMHANYFFHKVAVP